MAIGDRDKWLPLAGLPTGEKPVPEYKHQSYGNEVRVEVDGCETRLVFVGSSHAAADKLADDLLTQLKKGSIKINIGGKISKITEE